METETANKGFYSAVTKVAWCGLLVTLADLILSVLMAPIVSAVSGGAADPAVYGPAEDLVKYVVSLLVILPLLGRYLHISLLSLWRGAKADVKNMRFYIPAAYTFAIVGTYLFTMPLVSFLEKAAAPTSPADVLFNFNGPIPITVLNIVTAVFVGPLEEEFLSRGLLLSALAPYGKGFAILTTSLLFALGHGSVLQFFTPFLLGLVFAYVTLETGTIKNSYILHAFYNGVSVLLGIVAVRSPSVTSVLSIAIDVVLGGIGVWVLIKKRHTILRNLRTEREDFVPMERRTHKFVCNPSILLVIFVSAAEIIGFTRPW